jgi:NhaP-type Na+/H+ or K+/H+ antiporter
VWAIPAALLLGYALGAGVGCLAVWLRSRHRDPDAPNDFLALALIALAYVGAEALAAWGFLAVFAPGVGLRRAETAVVGRTLHPQLSESPPVPQGPSTGPLPPAEALVAAQVDADDLREPAVAAGVLVAETLSFGDTLERLLEVLLVVLVGVCLARHWDLRAVPLALALFIVIRPVSTVLLLAHTPITPIQRGLMG